MAERFGHTLRRARGNFPMKCFVINLDRVPVRWQFINTGLQARGFQAQRFPAVDAAARGSLDDTHYKPRCGERWELSDSLIACFESHRRVWQTIVDRDLPFGAVFEDDVVLAEALKTAIDWLDKGEIAFDVAKLDTARRTLRMGPVAA